MKILHLTPQVEPELGGIATFTSRLVEGLTARGHVSVVVASHGRLDLPDESAANGATIHRLPFYAALATRDPRGILHCRQRLAAIKRAFAPEIVHLHIGGPMAFLHLATAHEPPAPLVATVHDVPAEIARSPTLVQVLETAAQVSAVSNVRLEDVKRSLPSVSRLRRIYPVVPRAAACLDTVRAPHPLLLTGGRFVPEKGLDVAVEALALVRDARRDVRLTMTGDGPMRAALADRSRALGVDGMMHFTGLATPMELARWRNQAWIALVPTRGDESFGIVALEAMQAGVPVVASRSGGLTEVIEDGKTGLLVTPGDAPALAAAILTLLSDEEMRVRLGRAGQRRAETVFDWNTCLDSYEQMFEEARA